MNPTRQRAGKEERKGRGRAGLPALVQGWLAKVAGEHPRSENDHMAQIQTEQCLAALTVCTVLRMKVERKEDNLCRISAVKIRQQDGESKAAGWLRSL